MAVIPPRRTGPILPLASLERRGKLLIVILAFEVIRAIPSRGFFALSTEELILELAILTTELFDLGFEVLGAMHRPSMLSLPISDLLPQFEILAPQAGDFLTQLGNLAPKLPYQLGQISRLGGRMGDDKRVFHDDDACNPNLARMKRSTSPTETGWAKLYHRQPIPAGPMF
jgi:hypothetical protein